tara:strand:+ start:1706 stop:2074 length:369 start_codon:yes stop_codon:yes gene_type:complete
MEKIMTQETKRFYIKEDTNYSNNCLTIKEIVNQSDLDNIEFKFEDSALLFTTDGNFIYATDIDNRDFDVFSVDGFLTPEKVNTIFNEYEYIGKERLKILAESGLNFADFYINKDIPIKDCIL